ncbi:MAG: hypothetical protein KGY81_03520 [Phycisphaerae bacterium]|nr:hypothetical protein [Phycisphaerae bacterium]
MAALVIAAGATVALWARHGTDGGAIRIPATAARPGAAGTRAALRRPTPHSVVPPNDPFGTLTVTDKPTERKLAFEVTGLPRLAFEPDFDVYEANAPDAWLTTPDGRVRLVAVGVMRSPSHATEFNTLQPIAYYTPADRTPLSIDDLPPLQGQDSAYAYRPTPMYRFVFECDGFDAPDAIGYAILDANTEVSLARSYSYSMGDGSAYVQLGIAARHGPLVDLAMDLAHGPVVEHRMPAEVGETWRHGPLHVEVLRHLSKQPHGCCSHAHNGMRYHGGMHYRLDASGADPFSGMLIGTVPAGELRGLDVHMLDPDGAVIHDRANVNMGVLRYLAAEIERQRIAAIRLRWRPHFKRLIWRVRLPASDPANQGVTDLMQVRVGYVQFEKEWRMRQCLRRTLQIEIDYPVRAAFDPPPGYFPATFSDATTGEILNAYLQHVAPKPGHHVRFDEPTMKLIIEPTWPTRMKQKISDLVDRLF